MNQWSSKRQTALCECSGICKFGREDYRGGGARDYEEIFFDNHALLNNRYSAAGILSRGEQDQ
jgi:hypothetical protein